jgi:hypothetical protein
LIAREGGREGEKEEGRIEEWKERRRILKYLLALTEIIKSSPKTYCLKIKLQFQSSLYIQQ